MFYESKSKMVICKICEKEFSANKGLSYHMSQTHGIMFMDYILKYYNDGTWPLCQCGCGKKTNWISGRFMSFVNGHQSTIRIVSKETRKKIGDVQRGRKLPEIQKQRISNGLLEHHKAHPEHAENMSIKRRGMKFSEEHKKNISITRSRKLSTGEIVINREKISQKITQMYLDGGYQWSKGNYVSTKTGLKHHYRSSWELSYMQKLDSDVDVTEWNYECVIIPYDLDGKLRRYIPDFLVVKNSKKMLVEVKPMNLRDTDMNVAKRVAAQLYCDNHDMTYVEHEDIVVV